MRQSRSHRTGSGPIRAWRRRGIRRALAVCLSPALIGSAVAAQNEVPAALPDYPSCLARAVAHFEMELARSRNAASEPNFELVSRDRVEYCGTLAIVACDRTEAPLACQADLAAEQTEIRAEVLAGLPQPAEVAGRDPIWSDGLYPQLWDVAHGSSAGPDCDGADAAYETWCGTRHAGLKLGEAVMLWQVARLLGVAEPAVEAGWVEAASYPPVMRPLVEDGE